MNVPVITVTELNRYIKKMFDSQIMLQSLLITGEISNFAPHYRTGHLYFSVKDENACIKAVMFARQASRLRFTPENGMKVLIVGRVGAFERDGVYQIYVEDMQPDGSGALAIQFEQLKKRLEAKGLFDASHKKPLPRYPEKIGVITSPTGAAVQDIFNITLRRWPLADIVFQPVTVQGPNAAYEISAALQKMNRLNACDVIIIGRGGGSTEDLWCFNDEQLAYAVYESKIPVVSAVGHETDFTISDFVADMRAPTPSAAAELVTPDITQEALYIDKMDALLHRILLDNIAAKKRQLALLLSRRSFTQPGHFFDLEKRNLENSRLRLQSATTRLFNDKKNKLTADVAKLEAVNPLSVLLRGYSISTVNGKICSKIDDFKPGDTVISEFADGKVASRVTDIIKREVPGNGEA